MRGPGDGGTLAAWIADRQPPAPGHFGDHVRPEEPGAPAGVEALVRETEAALARALEPGDRPRQGAFDLLAADGFATWACEAALEDDDPETILLGLARRFAS